MRSIPLRMRILLISLFSIFVAYLVGEFLPIVKYYNRVPVEVSKPSIKRQPVRIVWKRGSAQPKPWEKYALLKKGKPHFDPKSHMFILEGNNSYAPPPPGWLSKDTILSDTTYKKVTVDREQEITKEKYEFLAQYGESYTKDYFNWRNAIVFGLFSMFTGTIAVWILIRRPAV